MLGSGIRIIPGPASATQGGILTNAAQDIGGDKNAVGSWTFRNAASTIQAVINTTSTATTTWPSLRPTSGKDFVVNAASTGAVYFNFDAGTGGVIVCNGSGSAVASISSLGAGTFNASVKAGSGGTVLTQVKVYSQSLTPSSVAANTSAEQTFTVTGLATTDKVEVNPRVAPTAGTGIVSVRVSAANTLAITFANFTAGSLTPASGTHDIVATRS